MNALKRKKLARQRKSVVPVDLPFSFCSLRAEAFGVSLSQFLNILGKDFLHVPFEVVAYHRSIPQGVSKVFPYSAALIIVVGKCFLDAAGNITSLSSQPQAPGKDLLFRIVKLLGSQPAQFLVLP